ncbi:LuxR C-terminal-related transcriptional regulator [Actinomadura viridis]|uniref:LuxR C-terminal-related transcriptional regulator n=1 Tax=Actinomadura viridis TaxID=58110 RepID=UPI0036AC34D4
MVGREDELELLRGRLADPSARLLTMTGPAGVGKTRLALALTAEAVPEAGYLDLAPYERPGAALEALSAACAGDRLVVADHADPVIEELAPRVPRLLAERPGARLLVASREPLRLYGERVLRVPPLARAASLELLRRRADAVRAGLAADAAGLERLCELLDDLPLAIEFAAARLARMDPGDLAARLREGQDVLRGGATLSRHAGMREAIGWSHDRLTRAERAALRALAAHEGAFSPADAPGADPAAVEALAAKNLLAGLPAAGGERRLRMLNTVRSYVRSLPSPGREAAARIRFQARPLTQRELEVAMLVARGLTDRQIADRLGIAEWTAAHHVRAVMGKLNCTSRVHVASWVIRDSLVVAATDPSGG